MTKAANTDTIMAIKLELSSAFSRCVVTSWVASYFLTTFKGFFFLKSDITCFWRKKNNNRGTVASKYSSLHVSESLTWGCICSLHLIQKNIFTPEIQGKESFKRAKSCGLLFQFTQHAKLITRLYNKLSYARILIGSHLWSIRGQTHRWRQRWIQVWQLHSSLNQSQFLAMQSNQSVRFILYRQ